MLHKSVGILRYSADYKLVVEVDQGLSDYYRSLIPKWHVVRPQKYAAHITVVRKEMPTNLEFWEKYEGDEVEFCYNPEVQVGKVYYWLNVFSCRLQEIREELGLPRHSELTRPPDGRYCFHMTIGNCKP